MTVRGGVFAFLFGACALVACADEATVSDAEIWNRAVDAYRAGDVTNALQVVTPLVGRRDAKGNVSRIGRNAAALAAKIRSDRAASDGTDDPLELLEAAAAEAQIALRAETERRAKKDDRARAERNFTRAVDRLPELRRTARINRVLKENEKADPGSLMAAAVREARALMTECADLRTNAPSVLVKKSDELSDRAAKLAEKWIPLRSFVSQNVTNEQDAAALMAQLDAAQKLSDSTVDQLADLEDGAYGSLAGAEGDFTRFFKMTALPPLAIAEDEIAQSNAWQDVEAFNNRAWQQEALEFTRAFRAKFPAWAKAYEQQAQADTNKPPFTAEDQAKISALATELEKLQLECAETTLPPRQQEALDAIRQIRELLPKDGSDRSGGSGSPSGSPQQKNEKQDPPEQQPEDQNQKDESDLGKQDRQPEQDPSGEKDEPSADEPSEQPEDKEVEDILKKAQERSDEHEAEKKARMRKVPLAPNERDW